MTVSVRVQNPLKAVVVKNFKRFGPDPVRIELSPINLVFGPNSAGKSGVIQALLALRQSWGTLSDIRVLRTEGSEVSLGAFPDVIHRQRDTEEIELGLEFERSSVRLHFAGVNGSAVGTLQRVELGTSHRSNDTEADSPTSMGGEGNTEQNTTVAPLAVDATVASEDADDETEVVPAGRRSFGKGQRGSIGTGRNASFGGGFDRTTLGSRSSQNTSGGSTIQSRNANPPPGAESWDENASAQSWHRTLTLFTVEPQENGARSLILTWESHSADPALDTTPDRLQELLEPWLGRPGDPGAIESATVTISVEGADRKASASVNFSPNHPAIDESLKHLSDALEQHAERLFDESMVVARDALFNLSHLGRVREPCERIVRKVTAEWMFTPVGSKGEQTGALLVASGQLVNRVNRSLRRLEAHETTEGSLPTYRVVAEELHPRSVLGEVTLEHTYRGERLATVGIPDVGSGVGQFLPILTEHARLCEFMADASNYRRASGALLMIEQPELHLHPSLQASLIQVLATDGEDDEENTNTGEPEEIDPRFVPQLLLESHSEHMVLRLKRLVKRGELSPDDVGLLVFGTKSDGSAEVTRVQLNARGEFDRPWPRGFFPERTKERS